MIADRSIGNAMLSAGSAAEMPLRFPSIRFRTLQLTHQPCGTRLTHKLESLCVSMDEALRLVTG